MGIGGKLESSKRTSGRIVHTSVLWEELRSYWWIPLGGHKEAADELPEGCPFYTVVVSCCWCLWRLFLSLTYLWARGSRAGQSTRKRQAWTWRLTSFEAFKWRQEEKLREELGVLPSLFWLLSKACLHFKAFSLKIKMGRVLVCAIVCAADRQLSGPFDFDSLNWVDIIKWEELAQFVGRKQNRTRTTYSLLELPIAVGTFVHLFFAVIL